MSFDTCAQMILIWVEWVFQACRRYHEALRSTDSLLRLDCKLDHCCYISHSRLLPSLMVRSRIGMILVSFGFPVNSRVRHP